MKQKQKQKLNKYQYGAGFLVKAGVVLIILLFNFFFLNNYLVLAKEISSNDIVDNCLADEYQKLEKEILVLLNQERAKNDLPALSFNIKLKQAARLKVDDMIENNYFAHISPEGVKPWDLLDKVGYDYKFAGENLAMNFIDAKGVNRALMNSKTHRENMLFENYTEVAVVVDMKEDRSLIAAEYFGKPIKKDVNNLLSGGIVDDVDVFKEVVNGEKNYYSYGYSKSGKNIMTDLVPMGQYGYFGKFPKLSLSPEQIISLNNIVMLLLGIIGFIVVVNIWVLEKEDEKIISQAKELCAVK